MRRRGRGRPRRPSTRATTSSRRCRSRRCSRPWIRRRPTRCRPPPATCATATSSPSPWWCPRRHASPTTGSTSTTEVQVGRIQNFGSWSPYMVKEGRTCLGLEFFVFEGDETWTMPDDDLVAQGPRAGPARARRPRRRSRRATSCGCPRRIRSTTSTTRPTWTASSSGSTDCAPNVHPVGRNGMHRYNNQDHSMFTAMLTVENIATGTHHDVWSVNVEEEYHEESSTDDAPRARRRDRPRRPGHRPGALRRRPPG